MTLFRRCNTLSHGRGLRPARCGTQRHQPLSLARSVAIVLLLPYRRSKLFRNDEDLHRHGHL